MSSNEGLTVRLIPLGGLGEFGLNALVLQWSEHLLLLDAGMMFPSAELPGVDSIVPDFQYLKEHAQQLEGILLTHGHEDHIGALAFALQAAPAPVFGSPLTLGLARRRLKERGVQADLRTLTPGQPASIGPFRVHPIRVAHSILDSLALAIETPAGVVVSSGDFKLGSDARDEERTDVEALAAWGERGVLALLSDSTNVERTGRTPNEDDVVPALEEVFRSTPGRVLVSCFATSFSRMQRVADLAGPAGRALALVGRRVEDNSVVARELGLLRISDAQLSPASSLSHQIPDRQAYIVSGSQGEPFSALSMISVDEHKDVAVGPGDTVVLSARIIPGNERTVSRLISNLYRRGCRVVHPGVARVHVSGHGSRGDLAELLRLLRPRYLMPIHGEYRMLAQHAQLAAELGMSADQVLLAEDGEALCVGPEGASKTERVPAGRVLLDRSGSGGLDDVVIRDRRRLSADGIVVPVVLLDKQTGHVEGTPEIVTRGFVEATGEWSELIERATWLVVETLDSRSPEERDDPDLARERVRLALRRYFRKQTQRRPMVIPVLMEV